MTTAIKKTIRHSRPAVKNAVKHAVKRVKSQVRSHVAGSNSKMMDLSHQASQMYDSAMKRVKKQPREAAGLCLGLGILASMVIWYRFIK